MPRLLVLLCFAALLAAAVPAAGQSIGALDVRLTGGDVFVGFSASLDEKDLAEIKDGMDKDIRLYVDLFRLWKVWPDEFVLGKSFVRTIKSDPIKDEHVATSFDGNVMVVKRFKSVESMTDWVMSVKNLKLTNTRELEPGQYFVRVTIESKMKKLPPLVGQFLIFVKETDFRMKRDSGVFTIEGTH